MTINDTDKSIEEAWNNWMSESLSVMDITRGQSIHEQYHPMLKRHFTAGYLAAMKEHEVAIRHYENMVYTKLHTRDE